MSKSPNRLGRGLSALLSPRPVQAIQPAPTSIEPTAAPAYQAQSGQPPETKQPAAGTPAIASGPHASVLSRAPVSTTFRTTSHETSAAADVGRDQVVQVPIDALRPNPRQPRSLFSEDRIAELAASIRTSGVIQPLLARPLVGGELELVAGERRWRAARMAGLTTVPVIIRKLADSESLELALVENLQREDLGPLERAAAYQSYILAFRSSADLLATRLGESRSNIVNYLRLLKLPEEIQAMIGDGRLGMGQARSIAGVEDPQRRLAIARLAARRNLSVRQVEDLVRRPDDVTAAASEPAARKLDRHLQDVQASLGKSLGLPVKLRAGRSKNSGTILISYRNLEEFDRIAERIGGKTVVD